MLGREAELTLCVGRSYQLRGEFDPAQRYFEQSLSRFEALGDRHGQAMACSRLAFVACVRRRFEQAQALVERALNLFDADDFDRADALNVRGRIAYYQADWPCAVEFYGAALALREEQGNLRDIARNLRDLGPALGKIGELDEAVDCLTRGIHLFVKVQDVFQEAACQINLANIYVETKRFQDALICYQTVRIVYEQMYDKLNLAIVCNNLGLTYRALNCWRLAEQSFVTSIHYWKQINDPLSLISALDGLGNTYLLQQKFKQAQQVLKEASTILDANRSDSSYDSLRLELDSHIASAQSKGRSL